MTYGDLLKNIENSAYDSALSEDSNRNFINDVEEFYTNDFKKLKTLVKAKIHGMAYQKGHSYGYVGVLQEYPDLLELAVFIEETK